MAELITLPTVQDPRGNLSIFQGILPNGIKRLNYFSEKSLRPKERHKLQKTTKVLLCTSGSCKVHVYGNQKESIFILNTPKIVLLLKPDEWRELTFIEDNTILLSISNTQYDPLEYIFHS